MKQKLFSMVLSNKSKKLTVNKFKKITIILYDIFRRLQKYLPNFEILIIKKIIKENYEN